MKTIMTSCVRSLGRAGTLASLCIAAALSACGGDSSTDPGGAAPGIPSALTAVANSTTQVTLNWVLPAGTVSEVKVQRSIGGAAYAPLITLKPATNSFVDTGLSANTAYNTRSRPATDRAARPSPR
jgi:long-subunit fatty acid transport protein